MPIISNHAAGFKPQFKLFASWCLPTRNCFPSRANKLQCFWLDWNGPDLSYNTNTKVRWKGVAPCEKLLFNIVIIVNRLLSVNNFVMWAVKQSLENTAAKWFLLRRLLSIPTVCVFPVIVFCVINYTESPAKIKYAKDFSGSTAKKARMQFPLHLPSWMQTKCVACFCSLNCVCFLSQLPHTAKWLTGLKMNYKNNQSLVNKHVWSY